MKWTAVMLALALVAWPAHAAETEASSPSEKPLWPAFVIGGAGALLSGAYVAGAVATGDQPSAVPLAVTGGLFSLGVLGVELALGISSKRGDPGSLVRYLLVPFLSGLAGAAIGGIAGGFGSSSPGAPRIVTHVVVVSFLLADTVTWIIAR